MLARIQRSNGLNLLLIGGWAVQAHGYSRNTVDVDCLTAVENDAILTTELNRTGFECFEEKNSFRRFRHRLDPLMVLDVMRVNATTFTKMWEASESYDIGGISLKVPALHHLVALKLHAARNEHRTDKDMSDIRALLEANPEKVSPTDLSKLCEQFGTPALTHKLASFL